MFHSFVACFCPELSDVKVKTALRDGFPGIVSDNKTISTRGIFFVADIVRNYQMMQV